MRISKRTIPLLSATDMLMPQKNTSSVNYIAKYGADALIVLFFIATIGLIPSGVHAANLLFKSSFGPGVILNEPVFSDVSKKNSARQALTGTDHETGYSWPIAALGATFTGLQLITADAISPSTVGKHITNTIEKVTGPNGKPVYSLSQITHRKGPAGTWDTHDSLIAIRPWTIGDTGDVFISYWYKHPADLADRLDNTVSGGNSLVQFAFKTGGYQNTWRGDYRISSLIKKDAGGRLFWKTQGDNVANSGKEKKIYWKVNNTSIAVPVGKWFKYEVFIHRSRDNDGRFWAAVNGQIITDHRGPNMGDFNLPINRISIKSNYSGGYAPIEGNMTDLEIWDGFPCGEGLSCHKTIN